MNLQALLAYNEEENRENFRFLLEEVLRRGYAIDIELKNGQTLLHHAVSLNMEREAVQLLRSGAQIMTNKYGKTPIDLALERGNQIMIQLLKRSADYHKYIRKKYADSTLDRRVATSADGGEAFGASKYAWTHLLDRNSDVTLWGPCYRLGEVYEDYLDWTDGQRAAYLLRLLESLRVSESKFQAALDTYSERKDKALHRLMGMDRDLREKEHRYCVKIWGTVEGERRSREELERISQHTQRLKDALDLACRRIFWEGEGQMRYYNGFVIKMWKRVQIRLSGASLHLSYTDLSSRKSRSRVIALEHIEKMEVSTHLVMFPLLRGGRDKDELQGEGATGARVSSEASGKSSSDQRRDKLYFTFYFRDGPRGTSAASPAGLHRTLSRGGPGTHSPLSPVMGLTPPPSHPIVVSVNDVDTSALLFLEALRSALMPHVTIATASTVLARELRGQDQAASTAPVDQDKQHASEYGGRRTGGATSGAGGEWSDGFSSGLTSVESLLNSSRSSTSTSRTYSFSSCSLPRSSSCSNRAWVGHIDTESPMDATMGGSGTPEGAEHMLSSSLPRSFFGSLNQQSPPSTCTGAAGSGPSSTGRGRMLGGTVLGRVVEERDGGERSTSNDSSAHSSSILSIPLAGGFAGQVFAEEMFTDCSSVSSKQTPVHSSTATPQSWKERDSFGSVIMHSSSRATVLARSVKEAVRYGQTCLSPPRSTRASPVSSLGISLALEEKSPQSSQQASCPAHKHQSQLEHCSTPVDAGVHAGVHDDQSDWKSVCSEGRDGSCPSSPRRVNVDLDEVSTEIAADMSHSTEAKLDLSESIDISLTFTYDDDDEAGGRGGIGTSGSGGSRVFAALTTDSSEDVLSVASAAPSVDLSVRRPSLLSLSLQRQSVVSANSDFSSADCTAVSGSPTPDCQGCAPPVESAAAPEVSQPLTYSCASTSYVPSSTAGYGLEFDMGSATLSPASRRRPSVSLSSPGGPLPPSQPRSPVVDIGVSVDSESVSSPPIKIPSSREQQRRDDDIAATLVELLHGVSEHTTATKNKPVPVSKPPLIDIPVSGPAPAHLYGTPTTSMSYDPMSVHVSLSLPEGERDEGGLSSLLPPSGKSGLRLQHEESDFLTNRSAASTFIQRELTAAAASSYASSLGENDEGGRDSDIMSCLEAGGVAERFSTVSLPMNMSSSMEKDDFAGRGRTPTKRARSDGRQLLLGKHYQRREWRMSEGHSATEATVMSVTTVDTRKSVHSIAEKLSRIRKKRDAIQERLVQYISERESHLQILHYLQSIRRVVARPPAAPADTHIYTSSPISQIEKHNRKAFSVLTMLHNSRQNSEDTTSTLSLNAEALREKTSGHRLQVLFDQAVEESSLRDEAGREVEIHSDQTDMSINRPRSKSESSTNSSSSCGSSSHRIRSRLPSQDRHISEAEQFVYSMLSPAAEDAAAGRALPGATSTISSAEVVGQESKAFVGLSMSEQVGPPPQPLMREYERCVRQKWR